LLEYSPLRRFPPPIADGTAPIGLGVAHLLYSPAFLWYKARPALAEGRSFSAKVWQLPEINFLNVAHVPSRVPGCRKTLCETSGWYSGYMEA